MESAVHALLKKTIEEHKRIIFNGNGYTDEWVEEAEKRGLYNLKTTRMHFRISLLRRTLRCLQSMAFLQRRAFLPLRDLA